MQALQKFRHEHLKNSLGEETGKVNPVFHLNEVQIKNRKSKQFKAILAFLIVKYTVFGDDIVKRMFQYEYESFEKKYGLFRFEKI